jgi:hypothetical protein
LAYQSEPEDKGPKLWKVNTISDEENKANEKKRQDVIDDFTKVVYAQRKLPTALSRRSTSLIEYLDQHK